LQDPVSKKTNHKNRAGGVTQSIGPEFKPQYCKKKKLRRKYSLQKRCWEKWTFPHQIMKSNHYLTAYTK
jgi:hypothetical protein